MVNKVACKVHPWKNWKSINSIPVATNIAANHFKFQKGKPPFTKKCQESKIAENNIHCGKVADIVVCV